MNKREEKAVIDNVKNHKIKIQNNETFMVFTLVILSLGLIK